MASEPRPGGTRKLAPLRRWYGWLLFLGGVALIIGGTMYYRALHSTFVGLIWAALGLAGGQMVLLSVWLTIGLQLGRYGAATESPRRQFRWYQFSLRTLLVVTTCFALICSAVAWFAHTYESLSENGWERYLFLDNTITWGTSGVVPFVGIALGVIFLRAVRWGRWYPLVATTLFSLLVLLLSFAPVPPLTVEGGWKIHGGTIVWRLVQENLCGTEGWRRFVAGYCVFILALTAIPTFILAIGIWRWERFWSQRGPSPAENPLAAAPPR